MINLLKQALFKAQIGYLKKRVPDFWIISNFPSIYREISATTNGRCFYFTIFFCYWTKWGWREHL